MSEMDEKASGRIKGFLDFSREAWEDYGLALDRVGDADRETQDILHWLEFNAGASEKDKLKMADALGEIRRERRKAKNAAEILKPAVDWSTENGPVRKRLERLLGDVRSVEKNTENRCYLDRTDIVARTLGEEKENAEG